MSSFNADPVQLPFLGRDSDLVRMTQAWALAKVGSPQWVALVGETGAGKTRLVREFYKWLAANEQASPYWPLDLPQSDRQALLNPAPIDFKAHPIEVVEDIPWLWWGLRGMEPGRRNSAQSQCAMSDALLALEPHLAVVMWQDAKVERRKTAAEEVGKKIMNWATGGTLDVYLSVAELVAASGGPIRDLLFRHQITIPESHAKNQASAASRIFQSIYQILKAQRPVVIILDDAQWLDAETLQFIDALTAKVADEKLKLLVVSTSWVQEWTSCPLREAFEQFRGGKQLDPLKGIADDLLASALKSELPGLAEADRRVVIERSNGNPRYLEELVLLLKEDPDQYFEDGDAGGALSVEGRRQVVEDTVDLDHVVRTRFNKLPSSAKDALKLGSFQGSRFLDSLISDVARTLTNGVPGDGSSSDVSTSLDIAAAVIWKLAPGLREFLQGPYHRHAAARLENSEEALPTVERAYVAAVLQRVRAWQSSECDQGTRDVMQSLIEQWAVSWIEHLKLMVFSTEPSSQAIDKFDELRRLHFDDLFVMMHWVLLSVYESRRHEDARRILRLSVDLAHWGQEVDQSNLPRARVEDPEKGDGSRPTPFRIPVDLAVDMLRIATHIGDIEFGRLAQGPSEFSPRGGDYLTLIKPINLALQDDVDVGSTLLSDSEKRTHFKTLAAFYRMVGHRDLEYAHLYEYVERSKDALSDEPHNGQRFSLVEALLELAELNAVHSGIKFNVRMKSAAQHLRDASSLLSLASTLDEDESRLKDLFHAWAGAIGGYLGHCCAAVEADEELIDVDFSAVTMDRACNLLLRGMGFEVPTQQATCELERMSFSAIRCAAAKRLDIALHAAAILHEWALIQHITLAAEFADFTMQLVDSTLRALDEGAYVETAIVVKAIRAAVAVGRSASQQQNESPPEESAFTRELAAKGVKVIPVSSRKVQPGEHLERLATAHRVIDWCRRSKLLPAELVEANAELCYWQASLAKQSDAHLVSARIDQMLDDAQLSGDADRARFRERTVVLAWFKRTIAEFERNAWEPSSVLESGEYRARTIYGEDYDRVTSN